jgi:hypothetical protein
MFKDEKHSKSFLNKLKKSKTFQDIIDFAEKEFGILKKELTPELRDFIIHKLIMILQGIGTHEKQAQEKALLAKLEKSSKKKQPVVTPGEEDEEEEEEQNPDQQQEEEEEEQE